MVRVNEYALCLLHYAKRKSKRLAANGGSGRIGDGLKIGLCGSPACSVEMSFLRS